MEYCYDCGTKLTIKFLEHEGDIPFCPKCNKFVFPIFSTAVSMVIVNKDKTKTLFVKQYGTGKNRLVAGYVNKGESAEECLHRELMEEMGVKPLEIKPQKTLYFEKSNTLLINYLVTLESEDVFPNFEIDEYKWYSVDDGTDAIKEASMAKQFYEYFMKNNR